MVGSVLGTVAALADAVALVSGSADSTSVSDFGVATIAMPIPATSAIAIAAAANHGHCDLRRSPAGCTSASSGQEALKMGASPEN
jgi:hypothetical protein